MDSSWEHEHFLQHKQQNYMQEDHSRPAAGPTCSSSSSRGSGSSSSSSRGMQQQQQAAEATSGRKHQQVEVWSILCAARHPLESAPSFFRSPLRSRPSSTTTNEMKKSDKALLVSNSRRPNRLGILSSSYLHPSYLENRTYDKKSRTHLVRWRNEY